MSLKEKLMIYANNHLNVLLIGNHGIGKTTVVKEIAEELGMRFKYYSSSTLDPFAELIGIPVPDKETKTIEFYRPTDLDKAEFVFFDELNRVTNPRVLNTILEIIQFKSINGNKLPNLKMLWAAINPPEGDYQVEDLDPALVDRFHIYAKMKADINIPYMSSYMDESTAKILKEWWTDDLDEKQQMILTPRRVEYIGTMISKNIPWKDAIPQGTVFPLNSLEERLKSMHTKKSNLIISKENVLEKTEEMLERLKEDPKIAIKISDIIRKFDTAEEIFRCRDLIEALPGELVNNLGQNNLSPFQKEIKSLFKEDSNTLLKNYPKISKAYRFDKWKV